MACPAVEKLITVLKSNGPSILDTTYIETNIQKINPTTGKLERQPPGPLPRLQATAGPHKSQGDPHDIGLALDIVLRTSVAEEKDLGEKLYKVFFDNMKTMRFVSAKYNHKECNGTNGWSTDTQVTDKKHETHIHIHWNPSDANKTDWESTITSALNSAFPSSP